ncbi:MAG: TetR-like C-terminal domain-containing protein [Oscillospiraceae bacterium]
MEKENQRVALTKRLLKEGLLRLLEKKELEKINVTELCREAGINRATFYRHYATPHDVLLDIEMELIAQGKKLAAVPRTIQEVETYLVKLCSYLYEHADLIRVLMNSSTDTDLSLMINDLDQSVLQIISGRKEYRGLDADSVRLISTSLAGGGYYLVRQWLLEDIRKTPEEVAALIFRMISREYTLR